MDSAIDIILQSVEAPSMCPQFLSQTVLWNYGDCAMDKAEGDIITKDNNSRLKMQVALCRPDGTKLASHEVATI